MALVSVSEVESVTLAASARPQFTAEEETAVNLFIAGAQGEMEDLLGRSLEERVVVGEHAPVDVNGNVFLAHTPVRTVEAVRSSGTTQLASGYIVQRWGLSFVGYGARYTSSFATSTELSDVEVDYTAGIDPADVEGLKSILLARVSRAAIKLRDHAVGARSTSVEGYSVNYLDEGFSEQEMKILRRRQRKVAIA